MNWIVTYILFPNFRPCLPLLHCVVQTERECYCHTDAVYCRWAIRGLSTIHQYDCNVSRLIHTMIHTLSHPHTKVHIKCSIISSCDWYADTIYCRCSFRQHWRHVFTKWAISCQGINGDMAHWTNQKSIENKLIFQGNPEFGPQMIE